jgi:hypothetical protein
MWRNLAPGNSGDAVVGCGVKLKLWNGQKEEQLLI